MIGNVTNALTEKDTEKWLAHSHIPIKGERWNLTPESRGLTPQHVLYPLYGATSPLGKQQAHA